MINLKRLLGIMETGSLTAEIARNRVDFGGSNETLESAVLREVRDLERRISNATFSDRRIIVQIYFTSREKITRGVMDHFKEQGFIVDLYSNPELPDYQALIIGW
jgi:hypothetical protein